MEKSLTPHLGPPSFSLSEAWLVLLDIDPAGTLRYQSLTLCMHGMDSITTWLWPSSDSCGSLRNHSPALRLEMMMMKIILTSVLIVFIIKEQTLLAGSASETAAAHQIDNEMKAQYGMIYLGITNVEVNRFYNPYINTMGDYQGSRKWLNISNPAMIKSLSNRRLG